jgi:WD40 repeat protein
LLLFFLLEIKVEEIEAAHQAYIRALVTSSNSELISASEDNSLKVWNRFSGALLRTINDDARINALAMLKSGEVAGGDESGEIRVWSPGAGTLVRVWKAHEGEIKSLTLLKNGHLLSTGFDKSVKVWEAYLKKQIRSFSLVGLGLEHQSLSVLLHNGDVVTASGNIAHYWTSPEKQLNGPKFTYPTQKERIFSLAALKNGYVAFAIGENVVLYNGEVEVIEIPAHSKVITGLAAMPNGYLASESFDQTIKIWNPASLSLVDTKTISASSFRSLIAFEDNDLATVEEYKIKIFLHKD